MMIYEYSRESRWHRQRRISRMMTKRNRHDVGVVLPDRTWQVVLAVAGVALLNAVLFVRWWLCV